MNNAQLLALAKELEFANAAVIDTDQLVFDARFRPYCAMNYCGKYGVNYACPPDCGSPGEMEARIRKFRHALVLQTIWDVKDMTDGEEIKPMKAFHNKHTRALIDRSGMAGLMAGASGCSLCKVCAITTGEPCRFPDKMFSCLSAYCINVKLLADACGMVYNCGPGKVAFFSLFCFD